MISTSWKKQYSLLEDIRQITGIANIHYIRQSEPLGLGHAVWCARRFIDNEPFAVLLGDDIVRAQRPCLQQLMDVYESYGKSVIGVQDLQEKDISRYEIIDATSVGERVFRVHSLFEKPSLAEAPSSLAITGRHVLSQKIFEFLRRGMVGVGGEVQLTDVLVELNQ